MSTTVIEALMNAQCNFETSRHMPAVFPMAMEQLENAIKALENGMSANDVIQESMFAEVNTDPKSKAEE